MRWMFLLLMVAANAQGEVVDSSAHGFTSEHRLVLKAPPDKVYEALTRDIDLWWDDAHSFGGEASVFSLDARAGGCFCENLPDGGSVQHMLVVNAQPGRQLILSGGLGPLQAMGISGAMTFTLGTHAEGTELAYRYVVGGYVAGGLEAWADPVDQVQLGQLKRLQQFAATGEALD